VEFCLFDHTLTRTASSLPLVIEGKYRLEQLIAHGGMGSVYRATHLGLERAVAIKILRAELLADTTARERFNREARAAARLKHPNIVAVYDSGHLPNGSAYLVMELIEGRSLREEMRAHAARLGQMRAERAAAILTQVCAGIEAAHRHGIIHRDLKPDNVMIETATDGTERVLVLDFGIAKLAQPEDREQVWQGLTDENTIIGTPNYISPEQCTGNAVDARSDVYALGVILYEMLTGHVPFAGQNTSTVLLKHLQEPPAPPHRFCPDIHPLLEQVVLQALEKNPQQRFSSASEFARHLLAAISERDRKPAAPAVAASGEMEDRTMTAPRPAVVPSPIFIAPPSPWPEQPSGETKAPVLLPDSLNARSSRARLVAVTAFFALAAISALAYFLYADWQAHADEAFATSVALEPTPAASSSHEGVQKVERKTDQALSPANSPPIELQLKQAKQTEPAAYVKPAATLADEKIKREVRAAYSEWAMAAARGQWQKHANFYADKVEYFRDGTMTRSKVEKRKRAIFGKLDSYWLRFSESPQIVLKNSGGKPEADVIFDRSWTLRRGRKQTSDRAQGMITLRRESRGWRIVSEKQIKK
jgi:serine/threonine protein kinase/ketosteroid isomerase-like protein